MDAILEIAAGIFVLWLVLSLLGFVLSYLWPVIAVFAIAVGIAAVTVGPTKTFFLLRVPVYVVGITLCLVILPLEYAFLLLGEIVLHGLIAVLRTLGAPFAFLRSAWFNRSSWSDYLSGWEDQHNSVKPEWNGPIRRMKKLNRWLTEGPKQ